LQSLAWSGDQLYASRGISALAFEHFRYFVGLGRKPVAAFRPTWQRRLSVTNRLSARLFRGGLHALAVLSRGGIVAAVAGSIVTLHAGDNEFRGTHTIAGGTRPLHITAVPGGTVYWGEYFDNATRDEVHIYASSDAGTTWAVAYTFPRGAISHVNNIVHDPGGGQRPLPHKTMSAFGTVSVSPVRASTLPLKSPPKLRGRST
jgi:hypothetical protein